MTEIEIAFTRPMRSASVDHGITPTARPTVDAEIISAAVGRADAQVGGDERQHGLRRIQLGERRYACAEQRREQPTVRDRTARHARAMPARWNCSVDTDQTVGSLA